MDTPPKDVEVLIVGAGPTGLMLANLLGGFGHSVAVLESRDDLIDYPRGVGLDDESFRAIQRVGLVDAVEPHTTPHHIMRTVNGHGKTIITNNPSTTEFGWPRKHGFIQPLVDRALFDGLKRFDKVEVYFGHQVDRVEETPEGLTAYATSASASASEEPSEAERPAHAVFRAQYLVGCEGGRSATRKRLGIEFEGKSPSTRWLVIDVDNDPIGTPNVFLGADPKRPYVSLGLPHAVRRFEFMLHDDEPDEIVHEQQFIESLLKPHVPDPKNLEVIRQRVFTHHGRVASTFRKGRQVIAGDAAHLMPVWMGQGWNSGVRDAVNLGWKLSSILTGQAKDSLLDTYTQERKEHAKAMVDLSMTLGSVIKVTNPALVALRDSASALLNLSPQVKDYFTSMRFKPMPRYTSGVVVDPDTLTAGTADRRLRSRLIPVLTATNKTSPVGVQFPQPTVSRATGVQVKLDDALGPWWNVLLWGNDPEQVLSEESLKLLDRLGAQLIALVPETQRDWLQQRVSPNVRVLGDPTGEVKRWFDDRPTPLIFLRPDRFVGAASMVQNAPVALSSLLKSLSASLEK